MSLQFAAFVQNIKTENEHRSDKYYVVVEVENEGQRTLKQRAADKQDFKESFYFIVKHPDDARVRLTIKKRKSTLQKAKKVMINVATVSGMHSNDTTVGSVSYNVRDIIKNDGSVQITGGKGKGIGTFTSKDTNATGDISYHLEYVCNQTK